MKAFFLVLCLGVSTLFAEDWRHKACAPHIESIEEGESNPLISLSNGAILRMRPVIYFIRADEYHDGNYFYFFREEYKTFKSIPVEQYHLEFFEGRTCQIILPKEKTQDLYKVAAIGSFDKHNYGGHPYVNFGPKWWWGGDGFYPPTKYRDIPINFHDTSQNASPIRVNLYEHPEDKNFFETSMPSSPRLKDHINAHFVEAELLQFVDEIKSLGEEIHFKDSGIIGYCYGAIDHWEVGQKVCVQYSHEGLYELTNLSTDEVGPKIYLSDPVKTDIRESVIYKDLIKMTDSEDPNSLLFQSISEGDLEKAGSCLPLIEDINASSFVFPLFSYKGRKAADFRDIRDSYTSYGYGNYLYINPSFRPLNHAITKENYDMVKLLLNHGAKPKIGGSTSHAKEVLRCLEWGGAEESRKKNMKKIVKLLEKHK